MGQGRHTLRSISDPVHPLWSSAPRNQGGRVNLLQETVFKKLNKCRQSRRVITDREYNFQFSARHNATIGEEKRHV